MLKHIFKIIRNERKQNRIIIFELAAIALIMWVVLDPVYCLLRNYFSPTGFDIEHTYLVTLSETMPQSKNYIEGLEEKDKIDHINTIYDRIKQVPGVEVAAISVCARPGSPSSIYSTYHSKDKGISVNALVRSITPEFMDVYRYEGISAPISELKKQLKEHTVMVSSDYGKDWIKEGESLLGDTVYTNPELVGPASVVSGILAPVRYSRYLPNEPFILLPIDYSLPINSNWIGAVEYSIRVRPDANDGFKEMFEKEIAPSLSSGNYHFNYIVYNPDQFKGQQETMNNEILTQGLLVFFLLVNVMLGVSGVFWFRTVKRRGQIGLRVSFGAASGQVQGQFILEGVIILVLSLIITALVMIPIYNGELLSESLIPLDTRRYFSVMGYTFVLMLIAVVIAVWMPTHRSIQIPPAQALREE